MEQWHQLYPLRCQQEALSCCKQACQVSNDSGVRALDVKLKSADNLNAAICVCMQNKEHIEGACADRASCFYRHLAVS